MTQAGNTLTVGDLKAALVGLDDEVPVLASAEGDLVQILSASAEVGGDRVYLDLTMGEPLV